MTVYSIAGTKGSGKTTKLFEYIIKWQSENEGRVFVTSFHGNWMRLCYNEARRLGITDIQFVSSSALIEHLIGRNNGLVAIDEFQNYTIEQQDKLRYRIRLSNMDLAYTWGYD